MPENSTADLPRGFGRRNPHCANCGDERGGDFGHETSECLYRRGMTAAELARTMSPEKAGRYWETLVDRYLDAKLAELDAEQRERSRPVERLDAPILRGEERADV